MRLFAIVVVFLTAFTSGRNAFGQARSDPGQSLLRIELDESADTIRVFRPGSDQPILTQNAKPNFRPYIHPIVAPDGRGVLTDYRPAHHRHQTGLYWGFTRVNGRDYFHHPEGDYWRRESASVLSGVDGKPRQSVQWQTVYDLLDERGGVVLTETQIWTMQEVEREYVLDLQWFGDAKSDVTIGKYDYGGLFLRMPWRAGIKGEVVNGARERDEKAEGRRATWVDVGMQVEGRDDLAHIVIFDHSKNPGFPQPWRVDQQLGVGPVRARLGDWSIAKGERATVRHQLRVYTGTLDDVSLNAKWEEYSGAHSSTLWGIAQNEGRAAEFLTPEKAVASMTLAEGFRANVFASEPMITQPMAFCWDDRGRLWIAENRDYETRGKGFSNSGDSRILILEDTDRDGVADRRKVFLEGIPFPAAIAVGFDGLWLGAPPNLLFVPDRNGDDRADLENIEVRLTGWGIQDRHETLNSLHWGPDGWLYGCQGFATPSKVGKPAGKGRLYKHREQYPEEIQFSDDPVDINGGIWRYHPTKERFEVVAHGFSNPWGIDYDAKGQLFITACVIPHLWHVIPGGLYHRQGGQHFNSYVYSDIQTIADHRHRSAHGGARVYQSDAFPEKYRGQIFMANIHEHAVLTDILERKGSGFVGRHGEDFLLANNAQWIGFSIEIGPDGAVYVLDWHDGDICGTDVLNKNTGRVFRIAPARSLAKDFDGRYGDLTRLTSDRLVQLQLSESDWHARRARLILQHRAVQGGIDAPTRDALDRMFATHSNSDYRLRAMWALHATGGLKESRLMSALDDADEHVRAWAIQLQCEDRAPSDAALQKFAFMAASDSSAVVRLYLAAALQRIPHDKRWSIASGLVARAEDADDHNIPKLIWYAIEPLVPKEPARALEMASQSRIPLLPQLIARRLTEADELELLIAAMESREAAATGLARGMLDALYGRFDITPPKNWERVFSSLKSRGGETGNLAEELAGQFGGAAAARTMLVRLNDHTADVEVRRQALYRLAGQRRHEAQPAIIQLLDHDVLRRDAIRALASYDDRRIADALLERYTKLSNEEKLDVIHTLASRSQFGLALTNAIQRGAVPKRDVPAYVARQLRRMVGNSFVDVWGPIDELSVDAEAAFTKYRELLTDQAVASADPSRGRAVFQRTCLACHTMYGEGGRIGPDITGANRTNLEYVLGNVLTPSAVIQDAYRMVLVLTDEGRLYSGILDGENERQLSLRVANEEQPVVIAKSTIESREIAPVSMMPDGLFTNLTEGEVLDLFAYLRTPQQVRLPDAAGK
jgi:putative membrane-bound dehydrogenase-like protein